MSINKDIDFVAKHYKKGLFNIETALYKIKGLRKNNRTLPKVAAISSIVVAIGATAAILITNSYNSKEIESNVPVIEKESPMLVSHVIDFDDAPLSVVVEQINLIYGVNIENIPKDADELYVSIHYEGTALDLVETLNEILGTNLKIIE